MIRTILSLAPFALLLACGEGGTPTAEENRELDEAERMLDEAPNSLSGIEENMLIETNEAASPQPESPSTQR